MQDDAALRETVALRETAALKEGAALMGSIDLTAGAESTDGPGLTTSARPDGWPYLEMAGQEVFRWAIAAIVEVAREAVRVAGISLADLDVFVPHQANLRITDSVVRALDLPDTVEVAREVRTDGNTSAASIPLALDSMIASGRAGSGDLVLIVGFGSGLTYCAQVIVLP